jgi:hypothetical protein
VPDYEEIQTRLDDIADTVDWASGWLEYIEENELRLGISDRELLRADADRLRLVADALVPGRVSDPSSGRRWYLAPDEAGPREQELRRSLATADRECRGNRRAAPCRAGGGSSRRAGARRAAPTSERGAPRTAGAGACAGPRLPA